MIGRVRLADAVEEALGIAKYYHRTKDRAIAVDVPGDLAPVVGLRDHVTQVVLNLVMNAVDATSKGGEIRVLGRFASGRIELAVEDDGRGIDPADHGRVFQPYFTTKPRGTGLGLYVCRKIVEEQGGTIGFSSSPGTGTTFTVSLPAAPGDLVTSGISLQETANS